MNRKNSNILHRLKNLFTKHVQIEPNKTLKDNTLKPSRVYSENSRFDVRKPISVIHHIVK